MGIKEQLEIKIAASIQSIEAGIPAYSPPENNVWTNEEDNSNAPYIQADELNRIEGHISDANGWINTNAPEIQRLFNHVDPDISLASAEGSLTEQSNKNFNDIANNNSHFDKAVVEDYVDGAVIDLGVALANYKNIYVVFADDPVTPNLYNLQEVMVIRNEMNFSAPSVRGTVTYEKKAIGTSNSQYTVIVDWNASTITIVTGGSVLGAVGFLLEKGSNIVDNVLTVT